MRITFIIPFASLNGGTRVVATYARILHDRGHEVLVVSQPIGRSKGWKAFLRGLLVKRLPDDAFRTPLLDFLGPAHRIFTENRPVVAADLPDADVVIATWWETAEWVAALPPSKGRKFYLLQGYEVFPNLPVDRVIATYSLPLTKIAVSSYIQDEIRRNHRIDDIHVILNSVDMAQFTGPPRTKAQTPTMGFLYTVTACKNIRLAIQAIQLAKERLPNLRVEAFSAAAPSADLPLPSWVEYHQTPTQAEIPGIYASCDAWLFTSEKEGFGLPIIESMACRTPVLATHAGAAPDLIDGRNGCLLPASPEAFAEEILRFARMSEEEWQGFSKAAHATAAAYTWDDATDRLLALFTEAVASA